MYLYVTRMYSCGVLVTINLKSLKIVCYSCFTRMYSCFTRMLLVCISYVLVSTRMLLVCTRMCSYVTRMNSCGVLVTIIIMFE